MVIKSDEHALLSAVGSSIKITVLKIDISNIHQCEVIMHMKFEISLSNNFCKAAITGVNADKKLILL